MAIKKTCDICGKEIKGRGNTVKGYSNTLIGSFEIFDRDLCHECFKDVQEMTLKRSNNEKEVTMKKNNMNRTFAGLLAMIVIVCAVVVGWAAAEPSTEQTKPAETEPEPLVINTVQSGDNMLLTVIREDETVFQYAGDIELWKATDGKAYGIIYLDEEVQKGNESRSAETL